MKLENMEREAFLKHALLILYRITIDTLQNED